MAKNYRFRFTARKAEKSNGFVSVIFGGRDTVLAEDVKTMTWAEAQAHLDAFAKASPGESMCSVSCLDKPVPPGYNKHPCQQYTAGPVQAEA